MLDRELAEYNRRRAEQFTRLCRELFLAQEYAGMTEDGLKLINRIRKAGRPDRG